MKSYELLREVADRLERREKEPDSALNIGEPAMVLVHPRYSGRFPFAGGGTELLSAVESHTNYYVPAHRILSGLAKLLKAQYGPPTV